MIADYEISEYHKSNHPFWKCYFHKIIQFKRSQFQKSAILKQIFKICYFEGGVYQWLPIMKLVNIINQPF